jgi:diguanylate cyclase (GGDEF)-like protein
MARTFPRKSDFVARFGGDEFAVVLRETSLKDGMSLGERLLKAARATEIEREGVRVRLSVSIGIGTLQTTEDVSSWLLRTDRALYQAKRAGRDRMVAADDISGALVVR